MFVSYPVNPLFVWRCPVMSSDVRFVRFEVLSMFKTFPLDKTDRDACLMYGRYVASIRGDEFCHRITKFCMFCPAESSSKQVENTVEKRRNCWFGAISPFNCVFKRLILQACKNQGLFGKGLILLRYLVASILDKGK